MLKAEFILGLLLTFLEWVDGVGNNDYVERVFDLLGSLSGETLSQLTRALIFFFLVFARMRLIPTSEYWSWSFVFFASFFDTMFLLISVSKKLVLKPSLHVWRCVEDADRAKIVEVCDGVLCKCVYVYYIAQWATAFLEALMVTGRLWARWQVGVARIYLCI